MGSEEEIYRSEIVGLLGQLRQAIKKYREAVGEPPRFILEKTAPSLPASALLNCQVFPHRSALLDSLPNGGCIAEVGTQHGYWASEIIKKKQPEALHLFDLSFDALIKDVANNPVVKCHKGSSAKMLSDLEDGYFDWIYVDGDHSYEGVRRDIEQAIRKVKPSGYLIFNDYTHWSPMEAIPYGVVSAVNELIIAGWEMTALAITPHGYWDVAVRRQSVND